jgi:hypothetical protein
MRIASALLVISCITSSHAAPLTSVDLTAGPWQFGLDAATRSLPVGAAFKQGMTGTVVTFRSDGTLRMDLPCRDEEFLRSTGGSFHIEGTWSLAPQGALSLTLSFGAEKRVENYVATMEGSEVVLRAGGATKRLGRFQNDLSAACRYE